MESLPPGQHVKYILENEIKTITEAQLFDALGEVTKYSDHWSTIQKTYGLAKTVTIAKKIFLSLYGRSNEAQSITVNFPPPSEDQEKTLKLAESLSNIISKHPIDVQCSAAFEKSFTSQLPVIDLENLHPHSTELTIGQALFRDAIADYRAHNLPGSKAIAHLIAETAEKNIKSFLGWSDLHVAIFLEKSDEEIEQLITQDNINLNCYPDKNFSSSFFELRTPIEIATFIGNQRIIDLLVKNGARPLDTSKKPIKPKKTRKTISGLSMAASGLSLMAIVALYIYGMVKGYRWLFGTRPSPSPNLAQTNLNH